MDAKPEAVKIPNLGGGKSQSHYLHSQSKCDKFDMQHEGK